MPIISDTWPGLETIFRSGEEILVTDGPEATRRYLFELPESERAVIGERARRTVLAHHTSATRVAELEGFLREVA